MLLTLRVIRLPIKTDFKQVGSECVLALSGKVTLGEASQTVRTTLEDLIKNGNTRIVLNLADVSFIDSAGLGILTMNYASVKAAGGLLKLAEAQERVKEALEVTRLTRLFPLYATEQEALQSFTAAA